MLTKMVLDLLTQLKYSLAYILSYQLYETIYFFEVFGAQYTNISVGTVTP